MKTVFFLFAMAVCIPFTLFGQSAGEDDDDRSERIQSAKVAYITSRLNLNTTQAQQFWPVYNEFEAARKKIRKQMRKLRTDQSLNGRNDEQLKADLKRFFALRQEELDLEKSYSDKFLTVISIKQLVEYYQSEKEFTKLLIKRLRGRGERNDGQGLKEE